MVKKEKETVKNGTEEERRYSKYAVLHSDKYRDRRDILDAVLDGDKTYTIDEIDVIIQKGGRQ